LIGKTEVGLGVATAKYLGLCRVYPQEKTRATILRTINSTGRGGLERANQMLAAAKGTKREPLDFTTLSCLKEVVPAAFKPAKCGKSSASGRAKSVPF